MNQTTRKHARSARLPLAVITAGSLAISGVAVGIATVAPAEAASSVATEVGKPAADVPPIYNRYPVTAVAKGKENLKYNASATDFEAGKIVFDTLPGMLKDGTPISGSASVYPNTGESFENVAVKNDQVIITTDSRPVTGDDENYVVQQVSYGFSLDNADSTYLGGAINAPVEGLRLSTGTTDKLSGTPLLPTGSTTWKFDVPSDFFPVAGDQTSVFYYTDDPSAEATGGFVTIMVDDVSLSNGQVVLRDDRLQNLTEGTDYFVSVGGSNKGDNATSYVGLYDKATDPTPTPTDEPTTEPTPTDEPTTEPTPTDKPTPTPTDEPTTEPTPTDKPTPTPTDEPTTEPTPTDKPTPTPTDEPTTEPTATDVPKAEDPESGDQVAPGEEQLSYDSESSSVAEGKYVYNTNTDVTDGEVAVTYRTSPNAKAQVITGSVKNGKLTINADDTFASSVSDNNQLLISVKDSSGHVVSALLSGANVLALDSNVVDGRLGVRLSEAGQKELRFKIPADFPEIADGYDFDLQYVAANGKPVTLESVEFTVDGQLLVINDPRVAKLSAGTYYLKGTEESSSIADTSAFAAAADQEAATVSTWFGLFTPGQEPTAEPPQEPTAEPSEEPTTDPSDDSTTDPSDDPTVEPTNESSPTSTATASPSAPDQERDSSDEENPKDDRLADTGVSTGLLLSGGIALGLIVVGAIAIAMRRRGRHG
ncbi:hypothetical protein [Glutamicibacter sp. JC586]|uniref:hypothetical protein n=1 Tax=Glutamicibacter sp. JC586 TaxID=2590552 RepID=UPI00190F6451|nr:hypothetical protein [Glutamicibacter sp. JC586]